MRTILLGGFNQPPFLRLSLFFEAYFVQVCRLALVLNVYKLPARKKVMGGTSEKPRLILLLGYITRAPDACWRKADEKKISDRRPCFHVVCNAGNPPYRSSAVRRG